MVSELQKKAAQAIVNIFETGTFYGDYGKVTLLAGDTGHLTYGRAQTTLASGNLHLLIKVYCETPGAGLASQFEPFLARLAERDTALDHDQALRGLLKDAGDDPVMRAAQDEFFDRVYWAPSEKAAAAADVQTGLGTAVVYDSHIHGSWRLVRDRTTERHGGAAEIGEQEWVTFYVAERREWLAGHANALLHKTVYRMDSFRQLIGESKWGLEPPLLVRGIRIGLEALVGEPPIRVSAEGDQERTLRLQTPLLIGPDVEAVQRALNALGYPVNPDGVFGPLTDAAVRRLQQQRGLKVDGIVGPATRAVLGI